MVWVPIFADHETKIQGQEMDLEINLCSFSRATLTNSHRLGCLDTGMYHLTVWSPEVQDQGVGMVGFF